MRNFSRSYLPGFYPSRRRATVRQARVSPPGLVVVVESVCCIAWKGPRLRRRTSLGLRPTDPFQVLT